MLIDAIEEMKKQLAEQQEEEARQEEEVVEQQEEVAEEAPEEPQEEAKQEEKKEPEEEKIEPGVMARMRREAAAAKKRAEEAEARLLELQKPKEEPEHEEIRLLPEVAELVQEAKRGKAEREFSMIESEFQRTAPDYPAVASEYVSALAQSIRLQNPRLAPQQLSDLVKETVLHKAAAYAREGLNPAEELYNDAKELGFTGKSFKKEEPKEEEVKPDLKKLAANRARSSGMTGASGHSEGIMTKAAAADLTTAEFMKLPKEERRRLQMRQ